MADRVANSTSRRDDPRGPRDYRRDGRDRDYDRDYRDGRNGRTPQDYDHRFDDRRGSSRHNDNWRRRSRSPRARSPHHRPSTRDRMRDDRSDRYVSDKYRDGPRDRDRDRDYRDESSRGYRNEDRERERDREYNDRHRRSPSSVSSIHSRKVRRDSRQNASPRQSEKDPQKAEEEQKRQPRQPTKADSEEIRRKTRQDKLAEWKAKKAEEAKRAATGNSTRSAPGDVVPEATAANLNGKDKTPSSIGSPATPNENLENGMGGQKTVETLSRTSEVLPQKPAAKQTVKLDEKSSINGVPRPAVKAIRNEVKPPKEAPTPQSKHSGRIGMSSFGLKAKPPTEVSKAKNSLLDDEEDTAKRTLEKLPDFVPDENAMDVDEDEDLGAIASDDEEDVAAQLAAAEKRRQEATSMQAPQEDVMDVDPPVTNGTSNPGNTATEEDDIDPLDAFMSTLVESSSSTKPRLDEMKFDDDDDVNMESVSHADLDALDAVKKKKSKELPPVDHSKIDYAPFRKNFYKEPEELQEMTREQLADLRLELGGIKVKPDADDIPKPVQKWGQMGLSQATLNVIERKGFEQPTPIQAQAIPVAESGRDLIGIAETGSGKTLAYGLPVIRHIIDQPPLAKRDGPICLILAPTRELALQINRELAPFLHSSGLKSFAAVGGDPIKDHIGAFKAGGIHVLVATPGRLIELMQSNSGNVLDFKRFTYVVLDEADRMFDMGFEPQVMKIINRINPARQTVLFSATFPKTMQALATKVLMKDRVEVTIGGRSTVPANIKQVIKAVPRERKIDELLYHLGQCNTEEGAGMLVFTEKQETAEELLPILMTRGFPCNTIHGAKDHTDRVDAINDFKQNMISVLIATSVAARGLDVPHLKMVVNFDCPNHLEDYIHRCGRTGRAGRQGTAVTLVENPGQEKFSNFLIKALKWSGLPVPAELRQMSKVFKKKVKSGEEKLGPWNAGFSGKGLDRLDAERNREKKREKRAYRPEGADDSDSDSSDEEEPLPGLKKLGDEEARDGRAASTEAVSATRPSGMPAYPILDETKIKVNKTERPAAEKDTKPMSAQDLAKARAKAVQDRLGQKNTIHLGQPIDNKGPDAGAYHATVEINDFPQKARWSVTNRTNVAKILDTTGVSITTKGVYHAPNMPPGTYSEPKLYILVEGETELAVEAAMRELYRLLREATQAEQSEPTARTATGRYTIT